ncbi:PAS domain S-box-containing protein/diguanylate cyclase (GGDEF) domain-containing protein [Oryzisolibacter propanilivorax]|uniref:PAS domain S-box-containing protein/diguanylate cyclase (GGDEF) domain-containing protein n=1 Tax=Oryzisolibacter propanilivorax TaxID=1527607 RepID=A0A1G9QKP9_9BURK|nr:EAL domain-containing protein [Oryzisolibacter propanilivorax]SDM11077.1 PAS domain S-box-containing protein/diguanylate cyclase (GGDEF) domain-containing protein [Oryzisolibacter propanilivorax]
MQARRRARPDQNMSQAPELPPEASAQQHVLQAAAQRAGIVGWHLLEQQAADDFPCLLCWSPEAATLFGWPQQAQPLAQALAPFAPESRALLEQALRHCAQEGTDFDLVLHARRGSGDPVCLRVTGHAARPAQADAPGVCGTLQDVRDSEARFQMVARATLDVLWDWNLLTDALEWSEGAQALLGGTPQQLPLDGHGWAERIHADERVAMVQDIEAAIDSPGMQDWSGEYRVHRLDGSLCWIQDRGFILRDATGAAYRMVGGMRDISARKQAERQSLEEAHAHALLLQVQQLITRRVQPLEDSLRQAAQLALELVGAQTASIELGPGDQPALLQVRAGAASQSAAQEPLPAQCIAAPLRADGIQLGVLRLCTYDTEFASKHQEHLHILAGSLSALIQLRHVGELLRASERQYRALFAEHAQPMWVCEQGSLRLLAVNHAMVRQYGWSEEELLAMDVRALWPAAQRDAAAAALEQAGRTQAPVLWRHARRGGAPLDIEAVVGPAVFGERAAWQVLASDVTDRCRLEAELARVTRARRLRSACSQVLVRAATEGDFLEAVCRITVDIGGYALAWVGMARHDARKSIAIVAHAGSPSEHLHGLSLSWSHAGDSGRGPAGKAVRTGQTTIVADVGASPVQHMRATELQRLGLHGVVCLPLKDGTRTFGLLHLYARHVLHLGAEETQLLEALAADVAYGILSLRARAEQQRLQSALLRVASAVSAGTGAQFFAQLAQHMAQALDAPVACVGRLLPATSDQPERVLTLSYVNQGEVQDNGIYVLAGTPSQQLLRHRQFVVADRADELYPSAPILTLMRARGYVGQQLTGSDGQVLGILFVAFTDALEQPQFIVHMLQIFAARAVAELERQEADAQLRRQASLLDKARDAIVVRELDSHRVVYWNQGAERIYGWRREEALGHPVAQLLYRDTAAFERSMQRMLREGGWRGEIQQYDRHGRQLEIESRWTLVRGEHGQPDVVLAINSDIGQRKASEREIQRLAFFDTLTGLPNRLQLLERLGDALLAARQGGHGGALLFIDLDNFKTLNDTLGHEQGDLLLQIVARRLSGCAHSGDTAARLGGDEFALLLPELAGSQEQRLAQARQRGEQVLTALAAPYGLSGYQVRSTPSLGIALFDGDAATVGELLKQAEMAMYEAKRAGRHTLRFFDPAMQRAVAERAQLEADLREALAQGEFLLAYQPVVDGAGAVLGVEALARWAHPRRGMVSPATFIPLAEETGLILPLGRWVLSTACQLLAEWQRTPRCAHLTMAVNVSARQFRDVGFVQEVVRVLDETGAPAHRLKLELTESVLVEDLQATIATMAALRAHGVGFSLDDFGTGYSSLAYLKRMPLDQLKIDQSFVRDLLEDASDAAIVKTIIALADSLDLQAIAEGVETAAQRDWLAAAGCRHFQGYLFSRPLPVDQLERFLRERLGG